MKRFLSGAAAAAAIPFVAVAPESAVLAQGVDRALDEVTVTARKREESLQDIPVAISAFTKDDIESLDLRQLENISDFTPGFDFNNQGNQQPGRYNTQLKFRGLTTAQFSPSFATGALFIDGIYVLNGGTSLSLTDVERVEVIKGPQSAYFGRNTFGGAVNLITRDPNMQNWGAEVTASTSSRSNNDLNVFVEGPLIEDTLAGSLAVRYYDKEGQWDAVDGGRLGDEETTAINAALMWNVTDSFNVKLRYGYSEDDDGPPAQGFINGIQNDNCTGRTIQTAVGPANPERYVCGQVPDLNTVVVDPGAGAVSGNTFLPQAAIDLGLGQQTTNLDVPAISDIGLARETERFSVAANWALDNGYEIDFTAGFNEQGANWIRDFDLSDRPSFYSRDPQFMEDESYEIRLTSPQDGRLRWLVGANVYQQEFTSSGSGGDAVLTCLSLAPTITTDLATCIPGLNLFFNNSLQDSDEADVLGLFAAVDFDIGDHWTLIVEGRYQEEEFTKGGGLLNPGEPVLQETFDDFLPRVILRWMPTDMTNVFLSYSEGLIAGDFNSRFINADERERPQYLEAAPDISEVLPAETLEAWEIGWKQTWLGGLAQTNASVYYYEWANIKGRSSAQINETCRAGQIDVETGCSSDIGQMVGDPKRIVDPNTGELIPFFNGRNFLIPGDAEITGLEIEAQLNPADGTQITAALSYIDSEYTDYRFNFVEPIADFAQMAGNQTPRQPKWSGNASVTQFFNLFDNDAYVRGEMFYTGKAYVDESNLAYIDDYALFNLRAGLDTGRLFVEVFVTNLTDEDAWAVGSRWTDFSVFQPAFFTFKQGIAVSPLDRREIGIRGSYRFGAE